ncbi:sugar transferase [Pseudobdellovibrio exovorus]|uniref:Capsular polysaccharide synthesis enzyme Cap8M n=1 Tax=Pseudobdellovibrio exovorus JSS TaxID=1184267 RepID=M4VB29_9BACT|nr:sugar transferase [Pseudobdellovibrio exovorus]AGH95680.1 capsular polysaccharide synthesis enzyme Cap8M [Pseudobdellovibrio exovorus JSS]
MIKSQPLHKFIFDFTIALILLLLLSPILIVFSILILLIEGRPVFFTQPRPGLNSKIFNIYKFRTMSNSANTLNSSEDYQRITRLGSFLRRTSIDELPQLFNVLKGELSLVGPRPLLVEYIPLYNERQKKRHCVKPGITGWAQVNGRNAITWEEKFDLDVWYAENWSITLDIKILFLTFFKVIRPKDIDSSQGITMEKFKGSSDA